MVRTTNWMSHLERDWGSPVWTHWFDVLSRGRTLIRYDARGTGLSDRDVSELTLDGWVRDLEAVVDSLDLETFSLIGFCQGGPTAIAYAARHPERVDRLVLCNSYARGAMTPGASPLDEGKARALGAMIQAGWEADAEAFRNVFANLMLPSATREQQHWLADLQRDTVSAHTAERIWRAIHHLDVRDEARQLDMPTLVLHVSGNPMVPFESGRQLASLIPDSQFIPLEGDNHVVMEEDPCWGSLVEELDAFLEHRASDADDSRDRQALEELTPRENDVLELLARGLSNDEIAERLFISPKTVRNHVTRIYAKIDVDSRARAVVFARDHGI